MSHRNQGGFTLIELIISLAILATIAAATVISVRLAVTSQLVAGEKVEVYQRLRFIGAQLTEKIHSTHPLFLLGKEGPLFSRINPDRLKGKRILAFDGESKSVKFITTAGRLQDFGVGTPDFHEVHFFLGKNPDTDESGVIMVEKPLYFDNALQNTPESLKFATYLTLAEGVTEFKLRYLRVKATNSDDQKTVKYVSEWVDKLKTEPIEFVGKSGSALFQKQVGAAGRMSLPRAIEVSIQMNEGSGEVSDDDDEGPSLFPTVVIPTHTGLVFERTLLPEPKKDG